MDGWILLGMRRLTLAMSDDEDDAPPPRRAVAAEDDEKKKKRTRLNNEEEEEGEEEREEEVEEEVQEEATPLGKVVRVSGKGRGRKNHYAAFELDGFRYDLEDPVLLSPEEVNQKPYVAIIKDISQKISGESLMVTGQWFYRPEEAEKKGGGNWQSSDTRELFYSFHRDDIPAESVMHKCVVHFIPLNKQIPRRKLHPGFIVQKVYDTEQRRLFKLTDKDYEDNKQEEIDVLVNKTIARIGDLPDVDTEDTHAEDLLKSKRLLKRRNMSSLDVSRDDDVTIRSGQSLKQETPGSVTSNTSEYYTILSNFGALTGEVSRDKWLERLLQGIQFVCSHTENVKSEVQDNNKSGSHSQDGSSKGANGPHEKSARGGTNFVWPDAVVPGVTTLEKAVHEALSSDYTKYNQKMRQLLFNLKNNSVLATRLLKGELEPSKILNMSPAELKEGLTAEELASKQPEESARIQMTDARCRRCSEKKVGLTDIIQAGHGDRYQLECTACGNSWYASRDEVSTLTIETPNTKNVGIAPLATAKFENIEKKLVSPRESDKSALEIFKKTTEAYMPVLENQKSFKKPKDA